MTDEFVQTPVQLNEADAGGWVDWVISVSRQFQETLYHGEKLSDFEVAERMMIWWAERAQELSR
jgi:hypothetical protein